MSIVGTNVLGGASSSSFSSDSALKVPAGGVYQTIGLNDSQKLTFSFWVKSFMEGLPYGDLDPSGGPITPRTEQYFLSVDSGDPNYAYRQFSVSMLKFDAPVGDDSYAYFNVDFRSANGAGQLKYIGVVSPVLSDAWMHVHVVYDSLNADPQLRQQVHINGVNILSNYTSSGGIQYPTQSAPLQAIFANNRLCIGQGFDIDAYDNNFLIHDFHYVDESAVPATEFGEYDSITGQWQQKLYRGSHGPRGSSLDFSDGTTTQSLLADRSGNGNTWLGNVVADSPAVTSPPASRVYDSPTARAKPFGNTAALNTTRSIGVPFNSLDTKGTVTDAGFTFSSALWPRALPWIFDPNYVIGGVYDSATETYLPQLQDFFGYGAYATHSIGVGMKTYYEVHIASLGTVTGTPSFAVFLGPQNPMPSPWPFNMLRKTNNPFMSQAKIDERLARGYGGCNGIDKNETHCYDPIAGNFWEYDEGLELYQATVVSQAVVGDVIGVAADYDAGTISFYKNNVLVISTTATNTSSSGDWLPGFTAPSNGSIQVNLGRFPFSYAPPSGYSGLSSARYAEPSILKSESQFFTLVSTGTGAARDVTGLDFQPTLITSHAVQTQGIYSVADFSPPYENNLIFTSPIMDAAVPAQYLSPGGNPRRSQPGAPDAMKYSFIPPGLGPSFPAQSDNAGIVTFNSDGYTLGANLDGAFNEFTNRNYTQYSWKDPQVTPVVIDGGPGLTDLTTTNTLNSQAGISYATWAGNSEAFGNIRIPHNLGAAPDAVIYGCVGEDQINDTEGGDFYVVHKDRYSNIDGRESELQQSRLGSRAQDLPGNLLWRYGYVYDMDDSYVYGRRGVSNSVEHINRLNKNYWAMCIKSVPGFSKVSTFVGSSNGTRQDPLGGNFVHCGFKPAWILITGWDTVSTNVDPSGEPQREYLSSEWLFVDVLAAGKNPAMQAVDMYLIGTNPMGDATSNYSGSDTGGKRGALIVTSASGFTLCTRQLLSSSGYRSLNVMGINYHYIAFAQAPSKYVANGLMRRPSEYLT